MIGTLEVLLQSLLNSNGHGDGHADHGVVACAQEAHHFDIKSACRRLCACGAGTSGEIISIFRKTGSTLEYEHGDSAVKAQQALLFDTVKAGDTVITLEVPRLARSTKQLCEIIELVKSKSLRLMIVGSITLDCREGHADPMSEAFLQMAGYSVSWSWL